MSSSILLFVVGAVLAVNGATVKEKPAKGYYDAAQSQPAYPPPQQSYQPPPYYQPVYQPPQYALPNVDVNYCTVHASFPLVERRHKHHRDRRQAYGGDSYGAPAQSPAAGYGSVPNYPVFPSPFTGHHSRRFEREHCRYTAIFSQAACQSCCQIASAAVGTNTNQVTGALFVFDPKLDRDYNDHSKSKSDEKHDDKDDKRILQCICCLPKTV